MRRSENMDIMAARGYGNGLPYSDEPIMMEMELVDLISRPSGVSPYEDNLVNNFVAAYQSTNPGVTLQPVTNEDVFLKYAVTDNGLPACPVMTRDTMLLRYKVGVVENDFILTTNYGPLGLSLGRDTVSYRPLPYRPAVNTYPAGTSAEARFIYFEEFYFPHRAIRRVFQNTDLASEVTRFNYKSKFVTVFKSSYNDYWMNETLTSATYYYQTYWYSSQYNSVPGPQVVLPYTPLYAEIEIIGKLVNGQRVYDPAQLVP